MIMTGKEFEEALITLGKAIHECANTTIDFAAALKRAFPPPPAWIFGKSNNWRKLHGFPMKRRRRPWMKSR